MTSLQDVLMAMFGQPDPVPSPRLNDAVSLEGLERLTRYLIDSDAWNNAMSSGHRQMNTTFGPRAVIQHKIQRHDKRGAMSIVIFPEQGKNVYVVTFGRFNSDLSLAEFQPVTLPDWDMVVAAVRAFDDILIGEIVEENYDESESDDDAPMSCIFCGQVHSKH